MARLAARVRGGFYPCHPPAVRLVAQRLATPEQFTLLDPCCGEAEALVALATSTLCPGKLCYAVELEPGRAVKAAERMGDKGTLCAPASFFDLRCTSKAFALAWVNPPFDDEAGGGERVEYNFLARATELLTAKGVLAFVLPRTVVARNRTIQQYLLERYQDLAVLDFPADHAPYNECVVVGAKRRQSVPADKLFWSLVPIEDLETSQRKWEVPAIESGPKTFLKGGFTEEELYQAIAGSPLWNLTELPAGQPIARPPLPLAKGHLALLLASGQLDGIVQKPGAEPHVVRGTAEKVQCAPEVEEVTNDQGEHVKTVTTIKERIQLTIRAVGSDGVVRTFA